MNDRDNVRCALLGDVVGSKGYPDQGRLLAAVADALSQVNGIVAPDQPLEVTVGDEFQGAYRDVGAALLASLLVRVLLADAADAAPADGSPTGAPAIDARMGIGSGVIEQSTAAAAPLGQSGSAWWHARGALDEVRDAGSRTQWPRGWRTGFAADDAQVSAGVRAFLLCRDELVSGMDARDRRILLGLIRGERQADVADDLGISQPAVATRQREKGANAIFRAHESFTDTA